MPEQLKLRTAKESVGDLNSVGPLSRSPEASRPCDFPRCPAVVRQLDATIFCPVHSPREVLARARAIVKNNFGPLIASSFEPERSALVKLRDDLLHDLENTV